MEWNDGKCTYRWIHKHTPRRASECSLRSQSISSPSMGRTSSWPVKAPERWQVKSLWSMPNKILKDCDKAIKLVGKEINNDYWEYRTVYWLASPERVEKPTKRWSPRSHSDEYQCQRTSLGDWTGGVPGAQLGQVTDGDDYWMPYRRLNKLSLINDTPKLSSE